MDGLAIEHPDLVRRAIAGEWLRADAVAPVLGAVMLQRHQLDAAERLRILLAHGQGALLCDDVGLGKTYVALAVAQSYGRPLVVAPASLREMWMAAAKQAGIAIRFVSMESLSRCLPAQRDHNVLIVDEAHHFRTPATERYRALADLASRSRTLLLSATPLHNKEADLTALLSLFLGSSARTLTAAGIARYIVRRTQSQIAAHFPLVHPPVRIQVPGDGRHLRLLLALPPPVPVRDGGVAAAMVMHTLVRLWASSDAALREGLRRRLARTLAIRQALEAGRYPTRRELDAWTYGEGAVQLGFAEILAPQAYVECSKLLGPVRAHECALIEILASLPRESRADAARVEHIRALRRQHPGERIVAFSQFAETVAMYYRGLARGGGAAMLTSRGARIASGNITRGEALERFAPVGTNAPCPSRAENVMLLIATDLLSEGFNLQDASVVIHLDLPWTAAIIDQRVGRLARLGSRTRDVFVYAIDPPVPSKQLLRAESIIRRKARLADTNIGASPIPPLFARSQPAPRSHIDDNEAIRRHLSKWIDGSDAAVEIRTLCAAVAAERNGVLALVTVHGKAMLVAGSAARISAEPCLVREIVELSHGNRVRILPRDVDAAVESVRLWMENELASDDAGKSHLAPTALARRLTARLAQHLSTCPRHERGRFSVRCAAMRNRIQSPFTLGIEREIEGLLERDASPGEILGALEKVIGSASAESRDPASALRAVLILRRMENPKRS